MPGYPWWDLFKVYTAAFDTDPLSKKNDEKNLSGAGVINPNAVGMMDIRADQAGSGSSDLVRIGASGNEMVDLTSVEDRRARYKEYERLRNIAEVENCMTVFADEACVAGDTKVATPFGFPTIQWLAENRANDRFLVYCWDFEKEDYSLGWAFAPRKTGTRETVQVTLDDGSTVTCTPDHRILLKNQQWTFAGDLKFGDHLMPFYKIPPNPYLSKLKTGQFPRIFTFHDGWTHERFFVDKWRTGQESPQQAKVQKAIRALAAGLSTRQTGELVGHEWKTIEGWLHKNGFGSKEIKWLGKKADHRRVVDVSRHKEIDVYDLSVEEHKCFATTNIIMHNCQKDDDGHICKVIVDDSDVKDEAEHFLYKIVDIDRKAWNWFKNDIIAGDGFYEMIPSPEDPKQGILKVERLPQETMFRIETVKGRIVEFQQSKEGPDLECLKVDITQATDTDLMSSKAIRFAPDQIVHVRHGEDRSMFRPYGVSLIEPARGPAHQLRMMEDAMLVYRLTRAPERRVFYIDVGTIAGARAEAFMKQIKDQFKKRKTTGRGHGTGANAVEERWHAPSADEDYWIPIRPNSNTRIDTLPGACLALDTEIPLLDGRNLPLLKIIEEYKQGKKLWTYSINPKTGQSVPGPITWAGITRRNTEAVRIHFDNGKSVTCTPDHNFPVQGKGKTQAKDLKPGDSMFPFKTRMENLSSGWKSKYTQVYDSKERNWVFVHRMVKDSLKKTDFDDILVFNEKHQNDPKKVIHHVDYNRLNNNPNNLAWMNWYDHIELHRTNQHVTNDNISKALTKYHENLSNEDKAKRDKILSKRSRKGSNSLLSKLEDPEYNEWFRSQQLEGWKTAAILRPELHKMRGEKITARNLEFWSNPENKKKVFAKQTISYPKSMFDEFVRLVKEGLLLEEILPQINSNQNIIQDFIDCNSHIKRNVDFSKGISDDHAKKMVKAYGYKGIKHLRKEANHYNHKVVKIEFLQEKVDTGTLTIDGNHEVHDYHTFALSCCGVYTYNSNLGEIDDALYFRNKLYIALNFPKNYFNQEDSAQTRITLSAQDVRFARSIERLQSAFEYGLQEMVTRHLYLMGFPEESYDELKVRMTPPSDWRELSRAEVDSNRLNKATTLKSSQLYSDFDIYVKVFDMTEDEAREIQSRMKVQKMDDLRIQIIANNPQIMGVGLPGDGETELGTEAGGPAPDLMPPDGGGMPPGAPPGPGGSPMGPGGGPPQGMTKYMSADGGPDQAQGQQQQSQDPNQGQESSPPPLPDASEDDIRKYHMGIEDYASEQDAEDIDYSEL